MAKLAANRAVNIAAVAAGEAIEVIDGWRGGRGGGGGRAGNTGTRNRPMVDQAPATAGQPQSHPDDYEPSR